jgi:hypothetical protein
MLTLLISKSGLSGSGPNLIIGLTYTGFSKENVMIEPLNYTATLSFGKRMSLTFHR